MDKCMDSSTTEYRASNRQRRYNKMLSYRRETALQGAL